MRSDRRGRQWSASAAGAALLFALSGAAVTLSASADPTHSVPSASSSVSPDGSADASAPPTAPASPIPPQSPSAPVFECSSPFANPDPFNVVPGGAVTVQIEGFPPNADVSLSLSSADGPWRMIGGGTTDSKGNGVISGVVPTDSAFGYAEVMATTIDGCNARVDVFVVGSLPAISIDDATVLRGQLVTIMAGGFTPDDGAALYLDGDPGDALCRCRVLATGSSDASGLVVVRARIPRDVSPGAHFLTLSGTTFDRENDLSLHVGITVLGGRGTMPPTDTV